MDIVKEAFGIAVVAIDGRYYVVGIDHSKGQVTSVLYADMPKGGGKWCGRISESGVRYVGHGSTRDAAMKHYRRLVRERRIEREAMRAGYASPTEDTMTTHPETMTREQIEALYPGCEISEPSTDLEDEAQDSSTVWVDGERVARWMRGPSQHAARHAASVRRFGASLVDQD
jgi:hypothetical protein